MMTRHHVHNSIVIEVPNWKQFKCPSRSDYGLGICHIQFVKIQTHEAGAAAKEKMSFQVPRPGRMVDSYLKDHPTPSCSNLHWFL